MSILNLSHLREDFKAIYRKNWSLGEKINTLIAVTKTEISHSGQRSSCEKKTKIMKILHSAKISMRTLQRWKQSYQRNRLSGISPQIRGKPPKNELPQELKDLITNYRKEYRWGSMVVQAHLLRDHNIFINRYQIDRFLKESGLKEKYPCTTIKKVKAKKRRHTKKVVVLNPGEHTQADVKYQLHILLNGARAYVYNFIDHASNWSYKMAFPSISARNTELFMEILLIVCPFKITRLQTDNGIEFTFKWASKIPDDPKEHPLFKIATREEIQHKLIPPGEKELQGLVERSHRQDDQEFYSKVSPKDLEEFNYLLKEYCDWRNSSRRFQKLNWLVPNEWLKNYNLKKIIRHESKKGIG